MDERYLRHNLIPDWDQQPLKQATVIVVGMGALGNEVARLLAMAGVGELILCDPDHISTSNLSRTILFRHSDVGKLKVETAAQSLQALVPGIRIQARSVPLVNGIGLGELRDASLILSCLDSRAARLQLVGRCQLVGAVYIDGGTHPWGGEVRPYLNPDGPCYGCSLRQEDRAISDTPWSCMDTIPQSPVGSAIPSSALVGTWMGTIALRYLMGLVCPPESMVIDIPRCITTQLKQVRDMDCPLHCPLEGITPIDVSTQDSLERLKAVLPDMSVPLAWEPIQVSIDCPSCGHQEERWGKSALNKCPSCGERVRSHTTLELDHAPGHLSLASLGIPPREILTIRTSTGLKWVELRSAG